MFARRLRTDVLVWAATAGMIAMYLVVVGITFYARVFDPTEYVYGESIVLDETHRLGAGQPLYAPPTGLPLTVTAYPPVYYLLVGSLQQLSGNTGYSVGRIVSVAAVVASAFLIAWSVHHIATHWAAGLLAAGLFVTQNLTVLLWGPTHRVDMLALCLTLFGLALATGCRTTLAAVPLALAVLTKQSYLAAPACVLFALWPRRGPIVRFSGVFVGTLLLSVGAGTWLTGDELLWHTVVANANPLDYGYFTTMLSSFAQFNALPLVAGAALFGLPARPAERLWRAYFVLSGLAALATVGKIGASSNYWLELTAATSVLIGLLAFRLCAASSARGAFTSAGLAGVVLASLLTCLPAYQATLNESVAMAVTGRSADDAGRFDAAPLVAGEPGPVLTDDPGLAILAGKRVEFELIFTLLAIQGIWDESPILNAIRAREFGLVIVQEPLDAPSRPLTSERFTETVRAALREAYAPAGQLGGYWLYRPR
ncbi:MAG: hypothetical protein JOZ87_10515 [Chloroflexi bacterium]|nr:hypothetical protein [Chloroflexota bacterium]